jgi:hypothetical protein
VDGGGKRKDGGGKRKAKEIKELDAKDKACKATPEDIARLRFLRWQRSGHSSKQKKKRKLKNACLAAVAQEDGVGIA